MLYNPKLAGFLNLYMTVDQWSDAMPFCLAYAPESVKKTLLESHVILL